MKPEVLKEFIDTIPITESAFTDATNTAKTNKRLNKIDEEVIKLHKEAKQYEKDGKNNKAIDCYKRIIVLYKEGYKIYKNNIGKDNIVDKIAYIFDAPIRSMSTDTMVRDTILLRIDSKIRNAEYKIDKLSGKDVNWLTNVYKPTIISHIRGKDEY